MNPMRVACAAILAASVLSCARGPEPTQDPNLQTLPLLEPTASSVGQRESFSNIVDVTTDSRGRTLVVDAIEGCGRAFDANDRVTLIGRRGQGPGECIGAASVAAIGDTVFFLDAGRVLVFVADTFVRSRRPSANAMFGVWNIFATDSGVFVNRSLLHQSNTATVNRLNLETSQLENPVVTHPRAKSQNKGGYYWVAPWAAKPWSTVDRHGNVYVSSTDRFQIEYWRNGVLTRTLLIDVPRVRVTPADTKEGINEIISNMPFKPLADAIEKTKPAKYKPAIARMFASPDGYLLVERRDVDEFDVLSSSDQVVARIAKLRGFTPYDFRGCDITGVTKDELDVQKVVRLRFAGPLCDGYERR